MFRRNIPGTRPAPGASLAPRSALPPYARLRWPRPDWTVRAYLQLIVVVLVLPGLVFCAVLMLRLSQSERARNEQEAQAAASRTADALDRAVANIQSALRVLATSPALASALPDLPAFDRQARAVAGAMDMNIVLTDRDGQQQVNTRTPPGAALPRASVMDAVRQVNGTGRPVLSNLFQGAVSGAPAVAVLMPVPERAPPDWILSTSIQPTYLTRLLQAQALPDGWVVAVIDGQGVIVARSSDHDAWVGHRASADLIAHATGERGTWTGTTVDGAPVLAAYARAGGAGWRVVVGLPLEAVQGPFRATLAAYTAAGAATLGLALFLAWRLGRRIATPLQVLALAGSRIGQDAPAPLPRTGIAEVDALAGTLAASSASLLARTAALASERARLAAVIDTVPVGLVIAAADGEISSGNAQVARMFRHPVLLSRGTSDYGEWVAFHSDGRRVQPLEYPLARVLQGEERAELTCLYQRGDSTLFWVNLVAAPILAADGAAIAGGVVAVLDMDEVVRAREVKAQFAAALQSEVAARTAELLDANQRLRDEMSGRAAAEDRLRQAQKMEAVGRLTGGIAHDFNNLLTIVVGSLDLLGRRLDDPRQQRLVGNAMEGATRAATLTARLLAFSRQQPLQPQAVDVNRLVSGMEELLARTLGEAVQVRTALVPDAWPVHADLNQLENALLNLAVNARDAMASGDAGPGVRTAGRLTITTANRVLPPGALPPDAATDAGLDAAPDGMGHGARTESDWVEIAVADTGCGMTPEVVAQVFEPFYTTKPQGKGTGLGLSQVHGFVRQSGGHVAIDTAPGQGTTMRILLPRLHEPAEAAAAALGPAPVPQAAGETVLVVEDEAGVRRYSAEALRHLGYAVIEAGTAEEGMRLLHAHPEAALLFIDIVLPDEDGRALAARARAARPGLPVLFTTGYAGPGGAGMEEADLVLKPFTIAALGAKVRAALGRD